MRWDCCLQEKQLGTDKVRLAKLLQNHNCVVRGGPEEGQKLMQALLVLHSPSAMYGNATSLRILVFLLCMLNSLVHMS